MPGNSLESFQKRVSSLGTSVLWDRSYSNAEILEHAFHNHAPDVTLAGPCFLVRTSQSILPILQALGTMPEHHLLVIQDDGAHDAALLGDIIMTAAKEQRVTGILCDGIVRDVAACLRLAFPVWSRGTSPKACKLGTAASIFPDLLTIGKVPLRRGDWLVGDRDGLIAIKADSIRLVAKAAEIKEKREKRFVARLLAGERLHEAMNVDAFVRGTGPVKIDF